MAQVGSLSVKLGLVTADFDRSVAGAKEKAIALRTALDNLGGGAKQLGGVINSLGGAFTLAGVGLAGLAQHAFALTDAITDSANAFGISVPKILAFREAIQASGGTAENADKIITQLFRTIEKGREGNEQTISQFERLGISFKDLNNLAPDELIDKTFQALAKVESKTTQVKAIRELLGRSGIGISPEQVAEELSKGTGAFDKYAESIKKVGEVQDRLKASMTNLAVAFADLIAPFTEGKAVSVEAFRNILIGIGSVAVISGLTKAIELIRSLTAAWGAFSLVFAASPVGAIVTVLAALAGLAAYASKETHAAAANASGEFDALGNYLGPGASISPKTADVAAVAAKPKPAGEQAAGSGSRPELAALEQRLRITQQQGILEAAAIEQKSKLNQLNEFDAKITEVGLETSKKALEIQQNRQKELKAAADKPSLTGAINKVYDAELKALNDVNNAKIAAIKLDQEQQYSFSFGWEQAFKTFSENADKASNIGKASFNAITSNIDRALDNWVDHAEISFKSIANLFTDLAASIIKDLIKIELKAQASQLLKAALGAGSGLFSSLFGGGSSDVSGISTDQWSTGAFAEGGTLPAGGTGLVGENGPEMIQAGASGGVKITPLGNNNSGVTINATNYVANVNAIDTQSFAQALASNKQYVYSANQSASRAVPGSR